VDITKQFEMTYGELLKMRNRWKEDNKKRKSPPSFPGQVGHNKEKAYENYCYLSIGILKTLIEAAKMRSFFC
jgi:hypothetical protein